MYQKILKQKIDLNLRKPFKRETIIKIKRLNELDYIHGAMALDGTALSRQQIEGMMEGEMPQGVTLKECVFVKNYMNALEMMQDALALNTTLDKRLLLKLHGVLTGGDSGYRQSNPAAIEFHHVPPHYSEVDERIGKLLQDAYKVGANEIHSASRIHCGIMEINPFEKYNEAMARMAMNYYLEERGFLPVALGYNREEYIKTVTECLKDKDDALFFWGLERAEYNKMELVLQIVKNDEEQDD